MNKSSGKGDYVYSPVAPSAPTVCAVPFEISGEVVPADIVIEEGVGVIPDRVVRDIIDQNVVRGNLDGDRIVFYDKTATIASQNIGKSIHSNIISKVIASNRDQVEDLSVRTPSAPPLYDFIAEERQGKESQGTSPSTSNSSGGYSIGDYRGMYDSKGGYQMQEYKSMYDK